MWIRGGTETKQVIKIVTCRIDNTTSWLKLVVKVAVKAVMHRMCEFTPRAVAIM
jgi:hypothetical protein